MRDTYRGIWKNIIAFGFASLRVSGVSWSADCRSQSPPKSFAVSGLKGRSMGLIEPR
jgi:hypothetical protein